MSTKVTARFRVGGVLKLQSRPGIFVCGDVIEGAVRAGMTIGWPMGDSVSAPVPIRQVEFIDYSPGIAGVALGVRFEKDEDEQTLRAVLKDGVIIDVCEADDPAG